ncbi:unnamed protein product [Rotaria sp. Silwood1]|nr:unnamed protein product [Rotaria sp. Silwood1]
MNAIFMPQSDISLKRINTKYFNLSGKNLWIEIKHSETIKLFQATNNTYETAHIFERTNAQPYLRLIKNENESDNDAFHRIINFQARSIGKATLQKIEISTKDDVHYFHIFN